MLSDWPSGPLHRKKQLAGTVFLAKNLAGTHRFQSEPIDTIFLNEHSVKLSKLVFYTHRLVHLLDIIRKKLFRH